MCLHCSMYGHNQRSGRASSHPARLPPQATLYSAPKLFLSPITTPAWWLSGLGLGHLALSHTLCSYRDSAPSHKVFFSMISHSYARLAQKSFSRTQTKQRYACVCMCACVYALPLTTQIICRAEQCPSPGLP